MCLANVHGYDHTIQDNMGEKKGEARSRNVANGMCEDSTYKCLIRFEVHLNATKCVAAFSYRTDEK